MAVQKNRMTRSKRNMRRSHDALTPVNLSTDPVSGEKHLRHHITKDGYYRGKPVAGVSPYYEADEESQDA